MLKYHTFVFSPFQENTYVLYDESGRCAIVDPGCYDNQERNALKGFIEEKGLTPELLLNTHCHLDHIFGNKFVKDTWGVPFWTHKTEMSNLRGSEIAAKMYGVQMDASPDPDRFLTEADTVKVGDTEFEVLFVPGHAAGHIAFYQKAQKLLFSGDVLFRGSIGRTDLPGGDLETLMRSIYTQVMTLEDDVKVLSGHGPETLVGIERTSNPFVLQYRSQFA